MDTFLFLGLLILILVLLPLGLGFLVYFIPKRLGYPKTAKYMTIAYGFVFFITGIFIVFEDQLFTKNDAKALIEEQDIKLTDDFQLVKNGSMYAIGDYFHTFTLKISERDKKNAITTIKNANNFKVHNNSLETFINQRTPDKNFGKKVIHNYETKNSFVREYFEPPRRKGYAPTFRRILITKRTMN